MGRDLNRILFGKTERIYKEYRDSNYDTVDPTYPLVSIYDPDGVFVSSGEATQESVGVYYYSVVLTTASATKEGIYQAYWEGTIGGSLITMDVPQYFYGMKVPWQTMQQEDVIGSIRRMIGDTNPDNYRISTIDMYYFLSDAVEEVQADFPMGYTLTITSTSITWNQTLWDYAFTLFKIKTLILVLESTLNDNLFDGGNVKLGDIDINVGPILKIRMQNIERLRKDYQELLYSVKMNTSVGHIIDTYKTGIINNTTAMDYIVYE